MKLVAKIIGLLVAFAWAQDACGDGRIWYVAPGGCAGGPNCGSRSNPADLFWARDQACVTATPTAPHVIRMATGPGLYTINNTLELCSNVYFDGGYDQSQGWKKSNGANTQIVRNAVNMELAGDNPRLIAVRGVNITNFRLQDIYIRTVDIPAATRGFDGDGVSNYALYLSGCSNYSIVRCELRAGNATRGNDGANGALGGFGGGCGNGGDGGESGGVCSAFGCSNCGAGASGSGGGSVSGGMGGSGPRAGQAGGNGGSGGAGGMGGLGASTNPGKSGNPGLSGAAGQNGAPGAGGAPGGSGSASIGNGGAGGYGVGSCCQRAGDGGAGSNAGAPGSVGASGANAVLPYLFSGGYFAPKAGTGGGGGGGGAGGGGGGGGGSNQSTFVLFSCCCLGDAGGGGGGGRGGGGGGGGGAGGFGGGGSFALFLWNNGIGSRIVDCNLIAGNSGIGGNGGAGGAGGGSASGCAGGTAIQNGGRGGSGGAGSSGGAGGAGGRGLDGPSWALFVNGNTPLISLTTPCIPGNAATGAGNSTCGGIPNSPYSINVDLLEGCTNSEITLAQTVGPNDPWTYNPATLISSIGTSFAVVWYAAQGWFTIGKNGTPVVNFTEFVNIFTDRPLPGIRSLYQGAPSTSVCAGEGMIFEHIPTVGRFGDANTTEWEWSFPGGSINTSGAPVPPSVRSQVDPGLIYYLTPGTYTVTLRAKHDCCGWSRPIQQTINVLPKPQVSISGPDEVCATGPMPTYTAVPAIPLTIDPDPEFKWYINGIPQSFSWTPYSANGHQFTPTSLNNGDVIKVEIRSTSPLNCYDAAISFATKTVTVSAPSNGGFAYINTPGITTLNVCPGEQHVIGVVGQSLAPPAMLQWEVSTDGGATWTNVLSGVTQTILTTPITTNTLYRVQVKNGSCAPAISTPVSFNILPGANGGTASAAPNTICSGGSTTLTVVGHVGSIVWQATTTPWNAASWTNTIYTTPTATVSGLTQTTYFRVKATSGSGVCPEAYSNVVQVQVTPDPVPGTILAAQNPVCGGSAVLLTLSGYTADQFQWQELVGGVWTDIAGATSDVYLAGSIASTSFFRVRVLNGGCGPVYSAPITINVIPGTSYGVSLAVSQNPICEGDVVTFTAIPTGGPPSPTYQFYVNGTPVIGSGNTYTTSTLTSGTHAVQVQMTVSGSCGSGTFLSNTINLTVNPRPTVSISGPGAGPFCAGTNLTFTATATPGSTIEWFVNGTFTGVTGNTFSSSSLVGGDQVHAEAVLGNCRSNPSNVITVNVDPQPLIIITASATDICQGDWVSFTASVSNAGPFPAYQWQINTGSGWTNIAGATGSSYISNSLTNGNVIRCAIWTSTGCGPFYSNPITMQVGDYPVATIASNPNPAQICQGQPVTFTVTSLTNGGTNPSYQWYVNGVPVGPNSSTFVATNLINGSIVTVRVTSDLGCQGPASNPIAVTVHDVPLVQISVDDPIPCQGQNITFSAFVSPTGPLPLTYDWYVNGVLQSMNAPTLTLAANTGDQVWCVVTNNAGCISTQSNIITVNADPNPTITISASSTAVCDGDVVTFTASVTNGGSNPIYDWKVNGVSQGVNAPVFSYTPANGDVVTCDLVTANSCAAPTSNSITLTVYALPTVTVSVSPSATVCAGTTVTFTATATPAASGTVYQWTLNGAPIGGNSPTLILSNPTNGDVVKVRVVSPQGCTGAASESVPITLTVNPEPTVSLVANPSGPICAGQTVNFTAVGNPSVGSTYTWYVNGVPVTGNNTSAFSTNALNSGDQVQVQITSAAGCSGSLSNIYTAQVSPTPSVSITASQNPICPGRNVTFTAIPTNGGSNPTINWYVNGNLVASGTSLTYTTNALLNGDVVQATITSSAGCGGSAPSNAITITVNPVPTVTLAASVSAVCQGTAVTFTATPTNGGPTPTYQWYVNGLLVATTNSPVYTTATLPVGLNNVHAVITSSTGCSGPGSQSNTVPVQVDATPTASISASATSICSGQTVQFIATAPAGVSYQWYLNGVPIAGATASTYTTSTLNDGDVVSCVVTTAGGCSATSNSLAITVQGQPTVSVSVNPNPPTICQGQTVVFTATAANAGSSPSYQWYVNNIAVGSNSPIFSTSTLQNGDVVTVRVSSSGGCSGSSSLSAPITATVHPNPTVQIQASANPICQGQTVVFISTVSNAGANPTYQWQVNGVNVPGATGPSFVTSTLQNGDVVQLVVTSTDGCPVGGQPSNSILMSVNPIPAVSLQQVPAGAVCAGTTVSFQATPISGATYQWTLNGNPILLPPTASTYVTDSLQNGDVVTVSVTSGAGCAAAPVSLTTTVLPSPTVSFTSNAPRCQLDEGVDFTNTGSSGATYQYLWDFGTDAIPTISTQENPTGIRFTRAGVHTVTLTITGPNGCARSTSQQITIKPKPTAAIAPVQSLCFGTPYSFQYAGTPNPDFVVWTFLPDGIPNASTALNPTGILFGTPGTKTVELITVVNGCRDTATVTFRVDSTLVIDVGPSDTTICQSNLPYVLDAGPNGLTYEWYINGNLIPGATSQTYSVTQSGIYSVRVTTATGCVGQDAIQVAVTNQIPVDLGPDRTLCAGTNNTITLYSGYPGATHTWTQNGQVIPTPPTQDSLVVSTSGTYGVTVQLPGSNCIGQDFVVVRLDTQITVNLGPDAYYCATDPIQPLVAPTVAGATYVWYKNGITIPGASGPTYTPSGSGTYVVYVLAGRCVGSDTVEVVITPNVTVSLPDSVFFCPATPLVQLEAPLYPGANYLWTLNGSRAYEGPNLYRISDTRAGVWEVVITTVSGCTGRGKTVAVQIAAPRPDFETEPALPARLASTNTVVRFTNTSQNVTPNTFFRWNFGDGTISTERNPTHAFPTAGTFYVTLYMYNGTCVDSIRKGPIIVAPVEGNFIPTAFTPNGDGINDILYFPALGYQDYELIIYNRWGQKIFHKRLGENRYWDGIESDTRRLAPEGAYVYIFKGKRDTGEDDEFTGTITLTR
ncbi:MAG: PKD domain-containing protein [Bacteroidia bacterium]